MKRKVKFRARQGNGWQEAIRPVDDLWQGELVLSVLVEIKTTSYMQTGQETFKLQPWENGSF